MGGPYTVGGGGVCNPPEYPENVSLFKFPRVASQTSQLPDGRPVTLICLSQDMALVIGYHISNKYYA